MADEPRNALWRRDEQLTRWNLSDTNKESSEAKDRSKAKIQFQDGCVFLAACSSSDTDEVEKLLEKGADINTANIDGLTALHQACIDDNLEMVQFLIEHKADIDAADNEGWTALHATASCGLIDIARYLLQQGANVAAVNNDGELAIDLAEGDDMEQLIFEEMEKQGIDAEAAREEEEQIMLRDANHWLSSNDYSDHTHAKTGATALHVAAAKGYMKVMEILLKAGADIDAKDFDGWTPLHAAAHWGQEEALTILVENFCNMETKNNVGQTAFDIADPDVEQLLEELKKKQATLKKDRENQHKDISVGKTPMKRRSSVTRMSVDQKQNLVLKNVEEERAQFEAMKDQVVEEKEEDGKKDEEESESEEESSLSEASSSDLETEKQNAINKKTSYTKQVNGVTPDKPLGVQQATTPSSKIEESQEIKPPPPKAGQTPRIHDLAKSEQLKQEAEKENEKKKELEKERERGREALLRKSESLDVKDKKTQDNEHDNRNSNKTPLGRTTSAPPRVTSVGRQPASSSSSALATSKSQTPKLPDLETEGPASWRAGLRKTGSSSAVPETTSSSKVTDKLLRSASSSWLGPEKSDDWPKRRIVSTSGLGETQDSRNRFNDLFARYSSMVGNRGSTLAAITTTATTTTASATTTVISSSYTSSSSSSTTTSTTSGSGSYTPYVPLSRRRLLEQEDKENERRETRDVERRGDRDRGSVLTSITTSTTTPGSTSTTNTSQRRSFEPPKRDEEKEVERKARAKRARETRRSTQGVTKEDLERAEETLRAAGQTTDRISSSDKNSRGDATEDLSSIRRRGYYPTDDKKDDELKTSLRKPRDSGLSTTATTSSSSSSSTTDSSSSSTSSYLRSLRSSTTPSTTGSTDTTATTATSTTTATTTTTSTSGYRSSYRPSYRTSLLDDDEKEKEREKEEESSKDSEKDDPSLKSAAIRTRKKREHRRPTGKISPEDVIEASQESNKTEKDTKKEEERTSRYGSSRYSEPVGSSSLYDSSRYSSSRTDRPGSFSGSSYSRSYTTPSSSLDSSKECDYKKLYEQEKAENEKLRRDVQRVQQDLSDCRLDMEKIKQKNESSRSYEITSDKREKRALERKISEMEEELKSMEILKSDNQRLKEENGALIRVISKLSK